MPNEKLSHLDYSMTVLFNLAAAAVSTLTIGNAYVGFHASNDLMEGVPTKHPGLFY